MTPNSPLINGLGGTAGFGENFLSRNDDGSTGFIDIRSVFENGLNFFGTTYNGFYINNNGNITFNSAQSTYTPFAITANTSQPIISPFFADVDTRSQSLMLSAGGTSTGSNLVYWDLDPIANRMIITWDDVGQYPSGTTPNAFQLVLTDTVNGNFNIEFRYEQIDWLVGSASGNTLARAGYSAGNGVNFFELAQSGTDTMAALETASNINQAGRFRFSVINGTPVVPGILNFGASQFSLNEDGTPIAAVTVIRTEGSGGAVSAKINFKDGTAKSPGDYTNTSITVNLAAGETSKTVNIPIFNDTTPEPDETVQLILTNPTGGATIGPQNTATLTIVDNDSSLLITGLPRGSTGSNKGRVTIAIAGQNFSPADQFSLISPTGTAKAASKVYWVNETEAWATFDLQGLTTGAYDVKVVNGSNSAILNDRFSVTNGPLGNLNVQLSYPSQGVVTLKYNNAGQTDLNAPLLRIVPTNAAITYADAGTTSATLKQLLNLVAATGEDSPSGILTPGERGEISFAFTPNGNGLISFAVQEVMPDEVINWASIKSESRADYSFIDSAGWDAIWTNLTASLGTTVGQFQAVMTENANYLSQLGQETNDLRRLFAFEWKQAVNTLTNVDLISTTDVVDAAPGLSLTFNRTFYQSVAERYTLGSLGRGWASQWDLRATTNSQGDVIIRSVGDLQRLFEKQTDGTFLEDGGAKVTITNGQYTLKETSGLISF
ncbi:MAG: nidogen-like domain-containing protein [Snowella sp.]